MAFEVKRTKKISNKDLRGLRAFKADYEMARCYVLYGGDLVEFYDNITLYPILHGLKMLPELLLGG